MSAHRDDIEFLSRLVQAVNGTAPPGSELSQFMGKDVANERAMEQACAGLLLETSTPPVILRPSINLIDRLSSTDALDIKAEDIRLPYQAFVVRVPGPGCIAYIGIIDLRDGGPEGWCLVTASWTRNKNSPGWGAHILRFVPDTLVKDRLLNDVASANKLELEKIEKWAEMNGKPYEDGELMEVIRRGEMEYNERLRLALGVTLYLASVPSDTRPFASGEDSDGRPVLPPIRSKHNMSPRQWIRSVASKRSVTVGKDLPPLNGHANTIVRGHFKAQPHGPRNTLRKIIWVQPHLRHRDDSLPTLGRDVSLS